MTKSRVIGKRFWLYSPGERARYWEEFYREGIMAMAPDEVGDLTQTVTKDDIKRAIQRHRGEHSSHMNDVKALWQFLSEMSIGDVIFAKRGTRIIVGRGIVESDYFFDGGRPEYRHVRRVKWTHIGEWDYPGKPIIKTLTDITPAVETEMRVCGGKDSSCSQ
jgi:5-methylcytosine-specific restriction protein B